MNNLNLRSKALGLLGGLSLAMVSSMAVAQTEISVWSDTPRLPTFEAYDEAHDDVSLKVLTVSPDELITKIQLAMRANADLPDVIFMSGIGMVSQLTSRRTNFLMDLTAAVPQAVQDDFYPNANSPCLVNGKVYCLRNDVAHLITWYDKPLMEELGMSVPTTWEEYEQFGADLAALDNGYLMGSGVQPTLVMGTLRADGCNIAAPVEGKEKTLRIDLSTESCLRPARMLDNMLANGSLSRFGAFEPGYVAQAQEGKVVLNIGPTWFGEFVMKPNYEIPAGRLSAALPPRWADQDQPLTWSWGGGTFGGWKDTEHPEIIADMVTWLATEEEHLENAVTMPAHKPASIIWGKRVAADEYYATTDVFETMLRAADYSDPDYVSISFDMRAAFGKTISTPLSNGEKLVDLLPAFQEELINVAKVSGYKVE